MRFLRHDGIYRSDVFSLLLTPGACPAFRSGRYQGIRHAGKNMPCPSSAMSSGRLILDRVGRHQSPSPLHRHHQNKSMALWRANNYHRIVGTLLTVCLTRGVHPTQTLSLPRRQSCRRFWGSDEKRRHECRRGRHECLMPYSFCPREIGPRRFFDLAEESPCLSFRTSVS